MDRPPEDDRSVLALAWAWATRIIVISAEMVAPGLFGYWLDRRLGTPYILMLLGFAFGMWIAAKELMQIARENESKKTNTDKKNPRP
jgi:F0F1-type ATP synthase assembly protein I